MTCSSINTNKLLHLTLLAGVALGACGDDAPADAETSTGEPPVSTGTGETTEDLPTTGAEPGTTSTGDEPATTTTGDASSGESSTTVAPTSTETGTDSGETTEGTTGAPVTWEPPNCRSVTGTGAVTFSSDQGATLAPMDQMITPVTYTFGLVALGKPGAMLAGSGEEILASADAGCSWHSIGPAGGGNTPAVRLVAAGDTRAYAFGDNDSVLMRVDDEVIFKLTSPAGVNGIVGLGVDPQDPDHVRLGDSSGQLWDSVDAGEQWAPAGVLAIGPDVLAYRAAFDPQDIDHALFGALVDGVLVTHDGGAGWDPATGLGPGAVNGFNLVVSPADGAVVWVEGLDLAEPDESKSRHVYRSEDGGASFVAVVDADDATLYNGNHLFAHPTDADVLYFVYGSNFGNYGTDLFRYDHADGAITLTHNKWHDTVITFLPGDPSWIYLGLSIEPGGG